MQLGQYTYAPGKYTRVGAGMDGHPARRAWATCPFLSDNAHSSTRAQRLSGL